MHTYTPAQVFSRAQLGIEAPLITVEVHIGGGLPRFTIVGLPETAVRESKDRVRAALLNSRFDFPPGRITVNLAPADLPKEGGRFDLPIAIGILAATSQIDTAAILEHEFVGELGLMGEIRGVHGVLPAAITVGLNPVTSVVLNALSTPLMIAVLVLRDRHLKRQAGTPITFVARARAILRDYIDFATARRHESSQRALGTAGPPAAKGLDRVAQGSGAESNQGTRRFVLEVKHLPGGVV